MAPDTGADHEEKQDTHGAIFTAGRGRNSVNAGGEPDLDNPIREVDLRPVSGTVEI